jgi:hypothetical protein
VEIEDQKWHYIGFDGKTAYVDSVVVEDGCFTIQEWCEGGGTFEVKFDETGVWLKKRKDDNQK